MPDNEIDNESKENHEKPEVEGDEPVLLKNNKVTLFKGSKKKLILISSIALIILVIGIVSSIIFFKQFNDKQLIESYNKEFDSIISESSNFKNQIENVPSDKNTLKSIVSYYQELKTKNTFETQVKDLNNKAKYASIKEKKEYSTLGLEKATAEFNDIIKDLDKLQGITQKSDNLDSEIKLLETTNSTIGDADKKAEELINKNNSLKDELLGVVVSIKLKNAQVTFADALTYRGKYLIETKAANNAYLAYKVAEDSYNLHFDNMNKYKNLAQTASYYLYGTYSRFAYEESINADQQKGIMNEKLAQQKVHKDEALKLLKKYAELMGIAAPIEDSPNSTVSEANNTQKKSITDDDVKLFIQDYNKKAVEAINNYDFSIVEHYLDKDGKVYKEQKDYIAHLKSKGISEKLLNTEVKTVKKLDDKTYEVSTLEQYNITYGDGSQKTKNFNSSYRVVILENNELRVNELLNTTEINSN